MRALKAGGIRCDCQAGGACSVGVAPEESDQSRRWYAHTQGPSAVLPLSPPSNPHTTPDDFRNGHQSHPNLNMSL